MWDGYYQLGDVEIINAARTEAYAAAAGLRWFNPLFENRYLNALVQDAPYVSPELDPAPWYEPRTPESAEFFGVYPLEVTGIGDSTAQSSGIERLGKGATFSLPRKASKTAVFNVLLIAVSEAGAKFGHEWLSRALWGPPGAPVVWGGRDLVCLSSEPQVGPWDDEPASLYAGDWDGGGA